MTWLAIGSLTATVGTLIAAVVYSLRAANKAIDAKEAQRKVEVALTQLQSDFDLLAKGANSIKQAYLKELKAHEHTKDVLEQMVETVATGESPDLADELRKIGQLSKKHNSN